MMKKYIYISFLIMAMVMLFRCMGQSGCENPEYTQSTSFILNGNFETVNYLLVEASNGQDLIGTWQTENDQLNTFSRIQFTGNGQFQEKVFSELTSELLATYEGRYTAENNFLIVNLNSGESYRFSYTLSENYLKITQ